MFIVHVVVKVEKFNNRFLKNWMQKKICIYHVYFKKKHIYTCIYMQVQTYTCIYMYTQIQTFFKKIDIVHNHKQKVEWRTNK